MKKNLFYSFFVTMLLALSYTNAMAVNTETFTPNATKIQGDGSSTTSAKNFYDAEATEWTITQSDIKNNAFSNSQKKWGGSYILISKFDCSAKLKGMIVTKATLKFTSVCTVSGKNSVVSLATIGTDWDPTTATWANTNTATIMQAGWVYTTESINTTSKDFSIDVTSILSEDEDKIIGFAFYTGTAREQKISNYSLEVEYVDASAVAQVTVKYVNEEGTELKASTTRNEPIGLGVTAYDDEKAPINVDGKKYMYSSDNSEGLSVKEDGTTELVITFRNAFTATLNVTTVVNGVSSTTSSNLVEADDNTCSWMYSIPAYILKDDVYYKVTGLSQYGETGSFTNGETIDKTFNYIKDDNIVFFEEWEKQSLSSSTYPITSNDNFFSDGKGRAIMKTDATMSLSFDVIEKGKYVIEMPYKNTNNKARGHIISIDGEAGSEVNVASNATGTYEKEVILEAGTHTITIKCTYSLTSVFDYALVRKTADLATVSAVGFATYSPSSNVAVPENVKVYTVTVNAEQTAVTLNPVEASSVIAAGTGYVIEATEGTYPFAVSNEAVSVIGDNALKVSDGSVTGAEDNIYVLAQRSNGNVGFSKVAANVTIPAGKAYLQLSSGGVAKASFLSFGGVTAIESVEANGKAGNNEYYTLQGVRTTAPVKGLYIVNGKKVVVK